MNILLLMVDVTVSVGLAFLLVWLVMRKNKSKDRKSIYKIFVPALSATLFALAVVMGLTPLWDIPLPIF